MSKAVAILGSTGSIGTTALRVIEALGADYYPIALSANSSVELLAEQAGKFRPKFVAVTDPSRLEQFKDLAPDLDAEILAGPDSLVQIAQMDEVDIVLAAVVGAAGLPAVFAAAKAGKRIAIANKEPLVIAGELLTAAAKQTQAELLPVDSEHSAIFQALQAGTTEQVSNITITSSGGPFRKLTPEKMQNVSLEQALAHPIWNMGPKITIDSATMMNKALEVIEAHWLFCMPVDKISVLIHPESVVHSMVEFVDGSIIAQLGTPDMAVPIQYALTFPKRLAGIAEHLKLEDLGKLTFEKPNFSIFRALSLGYEVARSGGTAPVVFNAANEEAVEQFLARNIRFVNIVELIEYCLDKHNVRQCSCLEELLEVDSWARKQVRERVNQLSSVRG